MVYATTSDVENHWQALSDQQTLAAAVLLDRVSALIRLASPGLDVRLTTNTDLATVVRGIAVDAVLRVLRNPGGVVSETIDTYAYRRADAVADGTLYLTPAELAQLTDLTSTASRGAFTIRPGVPASTGTCW